MLDLGADPHAADATGATPLTTAAQENADASIISMLDAAGAKLDFIAALNLKRYDLAAAMLDEDLPHRSRRRRYIALHLSVSKQNAESVRWLIEHGVDIDAKRPMWDCNHTALHMTAENGALNLSRICSTPAPIRTSVMTSTARRRSAGRIFSAATNSQRSSGKKAETISDRHSPFSGCASGRLTKRYRLNPACGLTVQF